MYFNEWASIQILVLSSESSTQVSNFFHYIQVSNMLM